MRKIVKRRGEISFESVILPDGIGIRARKHSGPISISAGGVVKRLNEAGGIITEYFDESVYLENRQEAINTAARKLKIAMLIASLGFFTLWVLLIPSLLVDMFFTMAVFCLAIMLTAHIWAFWLLKTFKKQEYLQMSKFRGALNIVRNAYLDLQRLPEFDELKEYSRVYVNEDYLDSFLKALPLVAAGITTLFSGWWFWISLLIVAVIICLSFKKNWIFGFTSSLLTSKPEEEHLDLVLDAMKDALEYVDYIEIKQTTKFGPIPTIFENCENCAGKEDCLLYKIYQSEALDDNLEFEADADEVTDVQ